MESLIKKLFLCLIFIVLILAGLTFLNMREKMNGTNDTLKVAFPYKKKVTEYEPTKIHWAQEYIFLENIFSPLVELSKNNGDPISAVAKSFLWVNNELHFEIRDGLYTIDGYKITAKDAEFSLKRLLILSKNTHGNLKDLICEGKVPNSVFDTCAGIEVDKNKLILKPRQKTSFLLKMLASIDFAILPIPSVDKDTLKIKDYRNTSGIYYVKEDNGKGNILLEANIRHFHFDEKIPQKVQLIPTDIEGTPNSLAQFKAGKVDFITTINKLNPEHIFEFSKENSHVELHRTQHIKAFFAAYTHRGIRDLSPKKRLNFGKALKKVLHKHYQSASVYKPTYQFFPKHGDGWLTKSREDSLLKTYQNTPEMDRDLKLHLSIFMSEGLKGVDSSIEKAFPNIKITKDKNLPAFTKYANESEVPDIFLCATDTGFMEDIGLITYSIKAGFFGLGKKEGQNWLKQYMEILDKEKRLKKLKELHFKSLSEGVLIPLVSAPYVALIRKPWKMELPQIYGNSQLWLIKKN